MANGNFEVLRVRSSNQPFKRFISLTKDDSSQNSEQNQSLTKAMEVLQEEPKNNGHFNLEVHHSASNVVHFTVGLAEIVAKIEAAKPVFVLCLKPNENSFSNQLNTDILIKQVKTLFTVILSIFLRIF